MTRLPGRHELPAAFFARRTCIFSNFDNALLCQIFGTPNRPVTLIGLASEGKGHLERTPQSWCALVVIRNRAGDLCALGITGAQYVLACKAAKADLLACSEDFAAAANSGVEPAVKFMMAGSKARRPASAEEELQEWARERIIASLPQLATGEVAAVPPALSA